MTVQQKRKSYQSFPDQPGGSLSFDKLVYLRLPPLDGRSFLDVGCNEGFFCGFARYQGARRVAGIDMNGDFVHRAKTRFPDCEFLKQTWDTLPDEKFDVILLASAIHYAEDQPALIKRLVDQLTPDGTLVLELGIVSDPANHWVPVKRSIDTRYFPTMAKLREVLEPYAWKYVGKSVSQAGDPTGRFVVHIRRRRPVAYLLMLPPSYGKTNIADGLFPKLGIRKVMGDQLLSSIVKGKAKASDNLKRAIDEAYEPDDVNWARITEAIFDAGLANDYISAWAGTEAREDIAFDGYVPPQHHDLVTARLREIGYFPICMYWDRIGDPLTSPKSAATQSQDYGRHLKAKSITFKDEGKPTRATGFVDRVNVTKNAVMIAGWAVNETGRCPDRFMVKLGGQDYSCRASSSPSRPDVQAKLNLADAEVGYIIKLPLTKPPGDNFLEGFSVRALDGADASGKPFTLGAKVRAGHKG